MMKWSRILATEAPEWTVLVRLLVGLLIVGGGKWSLDALIEHRLRRLGHE